MSSKPVVVVTGTSKTDATAFGHAISTAQKTYGHIDSLVLNAGVLEPTGKITSPDLNLEAWKAHFEVNFFSQVTAVRTVLPWLHKSELGGKIIFVSSGAATGNTHGWAPYNASKAASNSLCSLEGKMRDEDLHKFIRDHKEGNLVDPEDCGHVIAALALKAPQELTGKFVSWDSEECREYWDDQ
ncbi:hypothetical protein PHLCEN_2v3887 [Hermanssonia centrifuga]|uniref:Uncharacterized protein n=1 Tax=Hermanssonia centrifuga TaxID=98765 RepID=A0A2R6QB85_9APHY|nr:hypothetical protein PHLCEN_2v3887 [Hermanssonia centrifuga]